MAFPTGWNRKCKITIQSSQVDSALTDFPVLVNEDNLPSEIFDADGTNPAQNGGGDLRFSSDAAGATQLACEVVSFVTNNNPALGVAEVWVKVPSVSASANTDIYVWYNTAGTESQPAVTDTYGRNNVWDSSFLGVYHAENESSGATCVDSTGNGNTGTVDMDDGPQQGPFGSTTSAWGSDGSFDDVPVGSAILDNLTAFSVELWSYANIVSVADDFIWNQGGDASDSVFLRYDDSGFGGGQDDVFMLQLNNDTSGQNMYETSALSATVANWIYSAATWADGETPTVYLDGAAETLSYSDGAASGAINQIDNFEWGANFNKAMDGYLDEGRISNSKRSAAWVDATYTALNTPGTFAVAGTPEDTAGTAATPKGVFGLALDGPFRRVVYQ